MTMTMKPTHKDFDKNGVLTMGGLDSDRRSSSAIVCQRSGCTLLRGFIAAGMTSVVLPIGQGSLQTEREWSCWTQAPAPSARPRKTKAAGQWTPRDTLIHLLRLIDDGTAPNDWQQWCCRISWRNSHEDHRIHPDCPVGSRRRCSSGQRARHQGLLRADGPRVPLTP